MMKRISVIFALIFLLCANSYSQKVQYSKGTLRADDPAHTYLVSFGNYHHLISLNENRKPLINVFDSQLKLVAVTKLDYNVKEGCDIRIVPFSGNYLLYAHLLNSSKHELWKVNPDGAITCLSDKFQTLVDSFFHKTTATLDLVNDRDSFFVMAHTYYDTDRSMRHTIAHLDNNLNALVFYTTAYPFDISRDRLLQVAFLRDKLFVLKQSRDESSGNFLDISKTDFITGTTFTNSFNSPSYSYFNVGLRVDSSNLSVTLFSLVKGTEERVGMSRTIFIARLDSVLKEQSPLLLLKSQFKGNTISNFLFCDGQQPFWINIYDGGKRGLEVVGRDKEKTRRNWGYFYSDFSDYYDDISGVRFTLLDEVLKPKSDSIVSNKKLVGIELFPFAETNVNNSRCLVLIRNYNRRHHGLIVVAVDKTGQFSANDVRVYDRYGCILSQLRTIDNHSFVVPFMSRQEIGLMKVTFNE